MHASRLHMMVRPPFPCSTCLDEARSRERTLREYQKEGYSLKLTYAHGHDSLLAGTRRRRTCTTSSSNRGAGARAPAVACACSSTSRVTRCVCCRARIASTSSASTDGCCRSPARARCVTRQWGCPPHDVHQTQLLHVPAVHIHPPLRPRDCNNSCKYSQFSTRRPSLLLWRCEHAIGPPPNIHSPMHLNP